SSSTNESESLFGSRRLDAQSPAAPTRSDLLPTAESATQSAPATQSAATAQATPGPQTVSVIGEQAELTGSGASSGSDRTRPVPEQPHSRTSSGAGRTGRSHRHDVDVMRVLAGLTVMVGHSGGVLIGRAEEGSDAWWLGHFAEAVNPW